METEQRPSLSNARQAPRAPTLTESLIPVAFLIGFLGLCVINVEEMPRVAIISPLLDALAKLPLVGSLLRVSVDPHMPLIGGTVVAGAIAQRIGFKWDDLQRGMVEGIAIAVPACLILMVVGILIGVWMLSGIVPAMIYYGLLLLSPAVFLAAACLICAIVSLGTGSSWSTVGTVGVALMGVGAGLGLPLPLVAGAIISGAYFGDKMSPLSDTTNLASAVAGSELFTHIRHMVWTTGPSLLIALVLYGALGFMASGDAASTGELETLIRVLPEQFRLGWWLLLAPLLVIVVVTRRIPALPALIGGAVLGGVVAVAVQGASLGQVLTSGFSGFVMETGNEAVDELLSRGGLEAMMWTVALILCALAFGGIMDRAGMLNVLAERILRAARSTGSLVAATLGTCVGVNVLAPDQYLSLVIPGRMYRDAFEKAGLAPENLSRCLEDSGTLTSPLIPWNTCGAFMWATLGVFPLAYLPFAFLNLLNPLVSLLYGFTGWTMRSAPRKSPTASTVSAPDNE